MKFKILPTDTRKTEGSSLVGAINIEYSKLVSKFGEPSKGDGYKVDAEWEIEFNDGTIATIYNYKSGKNYLGNEGEETEDIRDWHIGGFSEDASKRVKGVLKIK
jgi:hypothetical protein